MKKKVVNDSVRNTALVSASTQIDKLCVAIQSDNYQEQLVALNMAINSLQDAKMATIQLCGGMSQ